MKSTGYPSPITKIANLKIRASVLATLLALPLSAFSFTIPQIEVPELPTLDTPNFDDNTGFKQNGLPLGGWGGKEQQSLTGEGLQNQINSSDQNYLLLRTEAGSFDAEAMVAITSDATVDGANRDLRFYQTDGSGVWSIAKNKNFSINSTGSLQFYGEDARYLIKQSSGSSLTISANDVWLTNKITQIKSSNGLLIFGNNSTKTAIDAEITKDFIATLDVRNVNDFESIKYSLIEGSSLSLSASNIFITQELQDSNKVSQSTGIALDDGGLDRISTLTATSNISLKGVSTGIYTSSALNIKATNLLLDITSYQSLHKSDRYNSGICAQKKLDVDVGLLYIFGAQKALNLQSANHTIKASTIYLDAGHAHEIDEALDASISYDFKSSAIKSSLDATTKISAQTVLLKNFSNGIVVDDASSLSITSSDIYIINEPSSLGEFGIISNYSSGEINSNSLNISGYKVGIGAYDIPSEKPLRSEQKITLNNELNLENVNTGIDVRNSDLSINTLHSSITTSGEGKAFSLSENAKLNFTSGQKSNILGDISVDNSTFSLVTGAESTLEGKAVNVGENSTLDITMGKKSHWTVTDASNLSTLNASDSTIILNGIGDSAAPSLSMDALTGTGNTFVLAHDENLTSVSFISVKESDAETTHTVQLGDSAITADLGEVNVQFATDESGQTVFDAGSSITEAGLFISSPELDAQTNAAGGKDWFITNVENAPAPTPESIVSSLGNNYFFWRGLTESTRERFGQLRHGESAGVWGRITAGALSYGGIEANYQTYRLGADTSINPNWKVGVMLEQHEGKLDASEGRGDMDATTASLYALYTGNNGVYADGGLRFGIMDYEYVNRDMLVDAYDYDSSAVGGWLEVGHEWVVAGGWTVSPHVAFSYGRFSAKDFTTDNGLKVKADSVDSGIFTLGTDLGFKLDRLEVLFTADAMHEALGDQTITVSHEDSRIRQDVDYSDTWAEFGFNLSYRPTDQSLVWLNVRRSALADVEQDWKINLGARLLFN